MTSRNPGRPLLWLFFRFLVVFLVVGVATRVVIFCLSRSPPSLASPGRRNTARAPRSFDIYGRQLSYDDIFVYKNQLLVEEFHRAKAGKPTLLTSFNRSIPVSRPMLFVHLPKTGGTTLGLVRASCHQA